MQKIIFLLAIILLTKINYDFYFSGLNRTKGVLNLIKHQQINNLNLQKRNNNQITKISAVKGDIVSLEARARYELNMVKKNEKLLILPGNYFFKVNKPLKINKSNH
jgi:cell division protein FtsB